MYMVTLNMYICILYCDIHFMRENTHVHMLHSIVGLDYVDSTAGLSVHCLHAVTLFMYIHTT